MPKHLRSILGLLSLCLLFSCESFDPDKIVEGKSFKNGDTKTYIKWSFHKGGKAAIEMRANASVTRFDNYQYKVSGNTIKVTIKENKEEAVIFEYKIDYLIDNKNEMKYHLEK